MQGYNLFAYCGNDPINRSDPTGEAWWHWALAGAVVVGCAVATVITAGGFAAAVAAVSAVGSGFAASTAAATISAGAFLGSATALGSAMMLAGTSSNTLSDFADCGDWGTVASTAFGAAFGGLEGYCISRAQRPARKPTTNGKSRGSTGRTEPTNLAEQLAMEQVKSNPSAGTQLLNIKLNDPRWPSCEGWVKMQHTVPTSQGKINIHYVFNEIIMIYDDFKFK